MNWLKTAVNIAREINPAPPAVIPIGEDILGKHYNVILNTGEQTSIVVRPGDDLQEKIKEVARRFYAS
jgi:hypothetical protein